MDIQPFVSPDAMEVRLGADVRKQRQRQLLTQAELAKRANISLSAVKSLEAGRGSTVATLVRVARALGGTDWLASFAPPEPGFSPLALLRHRANEDQAAPKRVRRGASKSGGSS